MNTLDYIMKKFLISYTSDTRMPIEIPNYGRNDLAKLFHELHFSVGAEIGTEQGEYAEILLDANPELMLTCIDAWQAYRGYRDHTRQEKLDRFYEITKERLSRFGDRPYLLRSFSMDALKRFADNSLDFVYIDANHNFLNATLDITHWIKKVRSGGILAGHDYIKRKQPTDTHVYQVVNAYTDAFEIRPWFVLGSNAKVEGEIRDDARSWMWVKP